jgi:Ribonuclease G/E
VTLRLLVACSPGELRIALTEGDTPLDYAIWRPGRPDGVGDLHCARILRPMPALGGAFVALHDGEAFLPTKTLKAGDLITVRVTRAAQGGKGPRLALVDEPATGDVRLLARGPGPLRELAQAYPTSPIEIDHPAQFAALRPHLGDRATLVRRAFSAALEDRIAALAEPEIPLPGGLRLRIHPTPALVAIDIDFTGDATRTKAAAQMAANLAVLPDLARQIRLRNLSGAILIDFAGLPARKRQALRPALETALAAGPNPARLLGFTGLGLAELVRPRIHPPLHELLASPHAAGLQALRAIAEQSTANPAATPRLRASPAIAAALQFDPVALPDLAAHTGRPLALLSDPALAATQWLLDP